MEALAVFTDIYDVDNVFDYLAESKRYDCEVVALKTKNGDTYYKSEYSRCYAAYYYCKRQTNPYGGYVSLTHTEKNALANAPTHIKPAWPRLSSPKIPTVRLREIAMIT